ncbi:MAG: cyclic nucleotide-binding domain-containing protein [Gammaproteobacteria bacterium]|nr:cyclic nucleotide-binding domain-containing protein [Gammaproteobacteria bacterium]
MKPDTHKFDWHSFISDHPLFGELNSKDIIKLLDSSSSAQRSFNKNGIIFRAGEISNSFYLIGEGSVNVELTSESSSNTNICTLQKGDYFGEMSAIDNQHGRAATITSNEDCTLLEIKSKPFQKVLKSNPELEFKLLSMLTERLRHVNDHLLKSTRLTYDTKFSLLSEKIESQSKVVDASLKASQSVFEQTKIRTDEIIHAAERGRSRITWVMSTLTAGFTLLLALFSFLGYDKLNTADDALKQIANAKVSVDKSLQEINDTKDQLSDMSRLIDEVKAKTKSTQRQSSEFQAIYKQSIKDSESAKRILFETLISMFMAQIEEKFTSSTVNNERNAITDPIQLGNQILAINDPFITIQLYSNIFYAIADPQQYIAENLIKITNHNFENKTKLEMIEQNKLNKNRINFYTYFLNQYISDDNARQVKNPLAQFLSNYILLITGMETHSTDFEDQLKIVKTKYNDLAGTAIKKQLYEDFISRLDSEISATRIKVVNNSILNH